MLTSRKNIRGLTLVEMVVTIAIMSILAAVAAPNFIKHLPGIRVKGDARDVASVMRLARMRAVAEGIQYGVFLDGAWTPDRYVFFQDTNESNDWELGADEVILTKELYRKTVFHEVWFLHDVAIFRPDGSSNGGWVSLGLEEGADTLVVDILPSTGRVKVIR
jgi:prepilin-type N-terminal cleavage/methylation domain-containing protein